MRFSRIELTVSSVAAAAFALLLLPAPVPSAGSTHGSRPHETVTVAADEPIRTCRGSAWTAMSSTTPSGALGPASSRRLGIHLRLRPLGRDQEPGRRRARPRLQGRRGVV